MILQQALFIIFFGSVPDLCCNTLKEEESPKMMRFRSHFILTSLCTWFWRQSERPSTAFGNRGFFLKTRSTFPFRNLKIFPLMFSTDKWNPHAFGERPQTDLIPFLEGKDPGIVRLRRLFAKDKASRPV